jgi:hypothetical protein
MVPTRKFAFAVLIAGIVLGIGLLLQGNGQASERAVRKANQPTASYVNGVMMARDASGNAVFGVPNAVGAPQSMPITNVQTVAAIETQFQEIDAPRVRFIPGSPIDGCNTAVSATRQVAAMVQLDIQSPCRVDADFVVWHQGMAFSGRTDKEGNASVRTPALDPDAAFVVTFDNIEAARVSVTVPDVLEYDRAVLQWRGNNNLQLHALELGATFGDPGHIWSASTQSPELAQQGKRGFMMRLGNSDAPLPYWAEVYTFPAGLMNRHGLVALQVGAAVTDSNCGRDIDAVGIQTNSGRLLVSQDLAVRVPPCDIDVPSVIHANMFRTLVEGLQ